jgi:hypothetical protein
MSAMRSGVLLSLLILAIPGCGRPGATRASAAPPAPVESNVPTPAPTVSDPALENEIRDFYDAVAAGDTGRIRELSTANTVQDHLALPLRRISTANFKVKGWLPSDIEGRNSYFKTYAEVRDAEVEYDLLEDSPAERKGRVTYFVTIVRETPSSPWRIDEIGCGP